MVRFPPISKPIFSSRRSNDGNGRQFRVRVTDAYDGTYMTCSPPIEVESQDPCLVENFATVPGDEASTNDDSTDCDNSSDSDDGRDDVDSKSVVGDLL